MAYNLGFNQYQPGVNGSAQNPYLQQNVNTALGDISRQYQTTTAPMMASRMASQNSFGNTGLQQLQAEQDRQFGQSLGNTAAQMYGQAYNADRANDLAYTNAMNANDTQRYGYDQSRAASQYASDNSLKGSMYGADQGLKGSMYGADKSAAASMYGADRSANASMYGADRSANASMYGTDNALKIAGMNNATTQRGQDQNYTLGMGNLGLGYGNLDNSRQQTANQYALGVGNLGLGYTQAANNYDLGLRGNDLGYANLDANIAQNNFGNQLAAGNFGLNVYNAQNAANQQAINAGTTIQNTPLDYYNNFTNASNSYGRGGSVSTGQTTNQGNQGNPVLGALGGYQLGTAYNKQNSVAGNSDWVNGSGNYSQYISPDYGINF